MSCSNGRDWDAEAIELWIWRRIEKISWLDKVRPLLLRKFSGE